MNRTVVSGFAAFALIVGAALTMTQSTAEAGHCGGGLFARLHVKHCGGLLNHGCGGGLLNHSCGGGLFNHGCGGGLLARLRAKHASNCCAPEPVCEPAPCETSCESACDSCGHRCGILHRLRGCGGGCDSGCGGGCSSCGGEVEAAESSSDAAPAEEVPPAPAADA